MNLCPACDADLDSVAIAVAVDVLLEERDEAGALGSRAYEAHVAPHDVEELRELIE